MSISLVILSMLVGERVTVKDWDVPSEVRQIYEASCHGETIGFEFRSRSRSEIGEKISIKIGGTTLTSPDLTSLNSIIHPANIESVGILSCNGGAEDRNVISGVFTLNQPVSVYGRMSKFISFKIRGREFLTDKE